MILKEPLIQYHINTFLTHWLISTLIHFYNLDSWLPYRQENILNGSVSRSIPVTSGVPRGMQFIIYKDSQGSVRELLCTLTDWSDATNTTLFQDSPSIYNKPSRAIRTHGRENTPPLLRYCRIFGSSTSPRKTSLPCFFIGKSLMTPSLREWGNILHYDQAFMYRLSLWLQLHVDLHDFLSLLDDRAIVLQKCLYNNIFTL